MATAWDRTCATAYFRIQAFLSNTLVLFIVSCIFHWSLVVVYIILLFFQLRPPPPFIINSDPRTTDAILFTTTSLSNAIFKVYSIILLFITQQLTFHHDLHRNITLPAFTDKSTAWLGVGQALTTLWSQRRVRTAPIAIFLVTIYLSCMLGLSIISPGVASVALVDVNDKFSSYTTYFVDKVRNKDLKEAFPVISLLPIFRGPMPTFGFEHNTIYDITQSGGKDTIEVPAIIFNVSCHSIAGLQQSQPGTYRIVNGTVQYAFTVAADLEDIHISPANRSVNIVTAKPKSTQDDPPLTMFVASTVPITDTSGEMRSIVQYSPGIITDSNGTGRLQIVACDMQVTNGTITIDTSDDLPMPSHPVAVSGKEWTKWNMIQAPKSSVSSLAGLSDFPNLAPLSANPKVQRLDNGRAGIFTPSMLEDNLMDWQGFYNASVTNFGIGRLEFALEEALAVVYWRAGLRITVRELANHWNYDRYQPVTGLQLQINQFTPGVGLALSAILAITSMLLAGQVYKTELIMRPNLFEILLLLLSEDQAADLSKRVRGPYRHLETSEARRAASKYIRVYIGEDNQLKLRKRTSGEYPSAEALAERTTMLGFFGRYNGRARYFPLDTPRMNEKFTGI